jgi:uncharacterized protein GlcG (DUF336 family)
MSRTTDIPLAEARALIARAIDKAEQIGMRGAVAVVGGSGVLVSASRMDHGGAGGMARARSKAWIAATQQIPSAEHLRRMQTVAPPMVTGFSTISPEAAFPGAGGMPVRSHGSDPASPVVAGIAASGAVIGPFVDYPGADPKLLIADGKPSNGEDLLVHYALGIPYEGQHGDDLERWQRAYGAFAAGGGEGQGMAPAPKATNQTVHAWALALADRAIDEAKRRSLRISVAIVDHRGDPIQQDRMDGAVTASVEVAQGTATAAATFGCRSEELLKRFGEGPLGLLAAALPFKVVPVAGGFPIEEEGLAVAGIGIAGAPPQRCSEIAAAALHGPGSS